MEELWIEVIQYYNRGSVEINRKHTKIVQPFLYNIIPEHFFKR